MNNISGLSNTNENSNENSVKGPTFRKPLRMSSNSSPESSPVAPAPLIAAPMVPMVAPAPPAVPMVQVSPVVAPMAPENEPMAPLTRQTSTQGFDKTDPEDKINYDAMIREVNRFLDTLTGFKEGTHARKGVHEFVYYFCQNADPDQVVDFLTAVLLPLQFNLETCRGMVSRIGKGYTLVNGRPPLSYLRMFSLSPSDQLPFALRHINQKNIDQGYLQEGTLNQYNDQALLSHTMDFFETELRKRKEEFTPEQISILLMDPLYKEGNALTICGVELIKGKGKEGRELEEEEEEDEEEEEEEAEYRNATYRLDFSPNYKIAGHVSNIKNLTLALVALADTNKDLLEHQETEYQELFATLQLELMMLMKLGRKFNTQHETLNYEFDDIHMKLVTSSYLSRLYVFAGNFRDMVRKEYLVGQEDKSQGRPFEKLFLFHLARSVALIACTVPDMEDAILLSKKLGPEPQRLGIFFEQYAKATAERNKVFLQVCQTRFTDEMFKDFPKIDKITIKTMPAVFNKYFASHFKRNGKVIGVFPEIVSFKEAVTFPKISSSVWKLGSSGKMTRKQLAASAISKSRNPDHDTIGQMTYEIVQAIEKGNIPTREYKLGFQDGIRLLPMKPLQNEQYTTGYLSGQRVISGMKGMIHEVDEPPVEGTLNTTVSATRAQMAYGAAATLQLLTLDGMENTLAQVQPFLQKHSLFECVQHFSKEAAIAASQSVEAYTKTKEAYDAFLKTEPPLTKKRDYNRFVNDEKDVKDVYKETLHRLRMKEHREKKTSAKAVYYAKKATDIVIPERFHVKQPPKGIRLSIRRPMGRSYKSRP